MFPCFLTFFYASLQVAFSISPGKAMLPPPPPTNDLCINASEIDITGDGFDTGVFQSETFDLTNATTVFGEFFDGPINSAHLNEKTIWFKFTIPAAREADLEWISPGSQIMPNQAGFSVYRANDCSQVGQTTVNAMPTTIGLGGPGEECLKAGTYYVQVCGANDANDLIRLELTLSAPYTSEPPGDAPYDLFSGAYDFGQIDPLGESVEHQLGCHSIDGAWEYENLPVPNQGEFNKSAWYVFTTGSYFDLFSILVETVGGVALPGEVGFRLYEGNVLQSPPTSLNMLEDASLLDVKGAKRVREYVCGSILSPNMTYSFELLFHKDYVNEDLRVRLCQFGSGNTGAPVPDLDEMSAPNLFGALPSSPVGTVTLLNDNFACDASLLLPQNQCGSVNPAGGVVANGKTYDLVTWAAFELAADATVTFSYVSGNTLFRYARIFNAPITDDCNSLDVAGDFFDDFTDQLVVPCMPAGQYAIQLLATSSHPTLAASTPLCDGGLLGRPVALQIKVQTVQNISDFGLWDANAFDKINGLQPLENGVFHSSFPDTFGCRNTVLPEGGSCPDRTKGIYRILTTADSGVVRISGMRTYSGFDFHYKLYGARLDNLAVAQNAFTETDLIAGAPDLLNGTCIENANSFYAGYYCLLPGDYTLAAFGGTAQIGLEDKPGFEFRILHTKYISRDLAEDLGDLVPSPLTEPILDCDNLPIGSVTISPDTTINTSRDTFSCLSNPDTIGGLLPCYVSGNTADKLIYRQFYLSESRIVKFTKQGDGLLNLFKGKATDPDDPLVLWTGLNDQGDAWQTCFAIQRTHPCDPLTPGWYTIVAYGTGASYSNPSLGGPNGTQGNLGQSNSIQILSEPLEEEKYDSPTEALQANNCQPTDWNIPAAADDYPNTLLSYDLGVLDFGCTNDLPWLDHPIAPCHPDDLYSLYAVFFITEPAFLRISGIPAGLTTVLFPGNSIDNPDLLVSELPVYPCSDPAFGERQICNLQPGYYTLVTFAGASDPGSIHPILRVERTGISRFDHAGNAYDFDMVPGNNMSVWGKPGDVHPTNPALKPSNDFIYCSTGAQPTDPIEDRCGSSPNWNLLFNPLIYSGNENMPLYLDNLPEPANNQKPSLRNIWYTFVLTGSGTATVEINHFPNNSSTYRPRFEIYKSDVNGAIPFANLVVNGGVDSTLADGLTFVASNRGGSNYPCSTRNKTVVFDKTVCESDTTRYYVIVTMWDNVQPNQQVELSIKYNSIPGLPVQFDHYSEANLINGLNQTAPPYTPVVLGEGIYYGAPASLECATRDTTDPFNDGCYERSVWYKFEVQGSGTIRLAHERPGVANSQNDSWAMRLYRETIPGDVTSLEEIDLAYFAANNPNNPTGHDWREGCYETGTYYIFWEDCIDNDFNILLAYRPIIWLLESPGDFCQNAIAVNVDAPGLHIGQARVDCHTIGTDFGEDGSNMGCLLGPEGLKTSWFKFTISSTEKLDVEFSIDLGSLQGSLGTPLTADEARARILYGSCVAMTAGTCLSSATASVTMKCLGPGDYYVQVVTPEGTTGEVVVKFETSPSFDQDCIPIDVNYPFANFAGTQPCTSDTVYFTNFSSAGSAIQYQWFFPNGIESDEFLPVWSYPKSDQPQSVDVTLVVLNTLNNLTDTVTQEVLIPPSFNVFPTDTISLCNCGDTTLAVPLANTEFTWQDGSTNSIFYVDTQGVYWVDMGFFNCLVRDSVVVEFVPCSFYDTLNVSVCQGEPFNGTVYPNDTLLTVQFLDSCQNTIFETTVLDVLDTFYIVLDTVALCNGDTFVFEGMEIWQAGLHEVLLTSSEGCDSTRALPVIVHPLQFTDETVELCKGQEYQPGISSDTVLCETLQNVNGCDSTHCISVVFKDTFYIVQQVTICELETYDFDGDPLSVAGFYCKTFSSIEGCDSTHCIDLTVLDTAVTYLFPEICQGDCFPVGDSCYATAGSYVNVLAGANGCDSTVLTSLTVHPLPSPAIMGNEPFCQGDSILLDAGPGFLSYQWSNGDTAQVIWAKDSGNYSAIVENEFGCLNGDTVTVEAVQVSVAITLLSNYNGHPISCYGASDGTIEVIASGGIGDYEYVWSNGAQTDQLGGLPAGDYTVTVTDAIGCMATATVQLNSPPPLTAQFDAHSPVCYSEYNGLLDVFAEGGTPPYHYSLNGFPWQDEPTFANMPSGNYLLELADANGCGWDTLFFLEDPPDWFLDISPDTAYIKLGESVTLHLLTNMDDPALELWTPVDGLDCFTDCLHPIAAPLSTTDYVLVLEDDKGCAVSDTVHIVVDKDRESIYIPNAFSPNGDGINDRFTVFAGLSVAKLNTFRIYDRWGGLVYETYNIPPNDPSFGWDGNIKGKPAQVGTYVFMVELEFKDGVEEMVKGDFALIR